MFTETVGMEHLKKGLPLTPKNANENAEKRPELLLTGGKAQFKHTVRKHSNQLIISTHMLLYNSRV